MKLKSYKFRLYPNKKQEVLLNKTFGCVRYAWNQNVATFLTYNKETNLKPIFKTSTELRKEVEKFSRTFHTSVSKHFIEFYNVSLCY